MIQALCYLLCYWNCRSQQSEKPRILLKAIQQHFLRNYYFADNIYLIIGSDNLINFNKWSKWKKIIKNCKLVVLSRTGYDKKAKKAYNFRLGKHKNIIFINNKKIDISSTSIKKKYR